MTWTLFAIFTSCPTLWRIIDTKNSPFCYSRWEGWVLTNIKDFCFKFISKHHYRNRTIFKNLGSLSKIIDKVEDNIPQNTNDYMESASSFYNFNLACFQALFPHNEYGRKLGIIDIFEEMNLHQDKDVIIFVSDLTPTRGTEFFNQNIFDIHVVCILQAKEKGSSPHSYNANETSRL